MAAIVSLSLPLSLPDFAKGKIDHVCIETGMEVAPGSPIVEFTVDLSGGIAFECPPAAHYRLVAQEVGVVASIDVAPGDPISAGGRIATLAVDALRGSGSAKVSAIGILQSKDWWDE